MVEQITSNMLRSGEWGEFFPAALVPFPYNLTHAHDFMPLTKDEALVRGYDWYEEVPKPSLEAQYSPPDSISKVEDSVLNMVLKCSRSGTNYKIQKGELSFYRKMEIPLPQLSPNERYLERLNLRTPRSISKRPCSKCSKEIWSSIPATSSLEVLCEEDFQANAD
jgi:hypothetical protein